MAQPMYKFIASLFTIVAIVVSPSVLTGGTIYAQSVDINVADLLPRAELFVTPRTGDFLVDATVEVPVYINTKGNTINAVSLKINFDPKKLAIINPSGGKSIFGIWVETPSYDNVRGTASLAGVIPNGIVTSSGLIATFVFKALAPGETNIRISDDSSANINDGYGSDVRLSLSGARYTISPKIPEGVAIASETHSLQDHWYNNNSPTLRWERPEKVQGFSTPLDFNPNTMPNATVTTTTASQSYENLQDGLWYFHVRARAGDAWGNASHFQIRIDTTAPAQFTPQVSNLKDPSGTKKYLVSFFTTDALSGIDHYEIGSIDANNSNTVSPVFIQVESPYVVPSVQTERTRVIIRAFDTAGNQHEAHVDLYPGFTLLSLVKKYAIYLLGVALFLVILELLLHYLFGHHILDHVRKAYAYFKKIPSGERKKK